MNKNQNIRYSSLNTDSEMAQINFEHEKSQENLNEYVQETVTSTQSNEMKEKSGHRTLNGNITNLVHVLTLLFVIFILFLSFSNEIELFTWHPILLAVGWSLFITEAILSFSTDNWITKYASIRKRVLIHWVLQICASTSILSGFIIILINKNLNNKEHFKTWHGTVGLISIILFSVTCFIGISTLYKIDLKQYISVTLNKRLHIFFGSITFICGTLTIILSLYSNWFVKKTNYSLQIVSIIIILIISLLVIIRPLKMLLRNIIE